VEDARAVRFFDEGESAKIRRPMEATLDTVFERASWDIVHISFKRHRPHLVQAGR
jgi:hypothetical protein